MFKIKIQPNYETNGVGELYRVYKILCMFTSLNKYITAQSANIFLVFCKERLNHANNNLTISYLTKITGFNQSTISRNITEFSKINRYKTFGYSLLEKKVNFDDKREKILQYSCLGHKFKDDIFCLFRGDIRDRGQKYPQVLQKIISVLDLFLKYDNEILVQVIKTYILICRAYVFDNASMSDCDYLKNKLGSSQSGLSRNIYKLNRTNALYKKGLDLINIKENKFDRRKKYILLNKNGITLLKKIISCFNATLVKSSVDFRNNHKATEKVMKNSEITRSMPKIKRLFGPLRFKIR